MATRRRKKKELTVDEAVVHILADERVVWFPVRHFSPACAWHVGRLIREIKPAAVLVEGPDDATPLIPYIVHADTRPPLTLFSSYVDKRNHFGLNGVVSPSVETPARFRAWWPATSYAPEYVALQAGHEVGAELAFIDAPVTATVRIHHARTKDTQQLVSDRHLAENAYFEALRTAQRRRSFDEFWNANFEAAGFRQDTLTFMRNVLTFAWCARNVGTAGPEAQKALEADGTLLRERHMRWFVDDALKRHPDGRIVVVTGAFHSAALPWTKRKKATAKRDRNLETLLTAHSFKALATLYSLNTMPAYAQAVWDQAGEVQGESEGDETPGDAARGGGAEFGPFDRAAMVLLLEVMRAARDEGEAVSTADAVGAYKVARNLATMRRNHQVTLDDLRDAVQMGYIKGDARVRGGKVRAALQKVLVGARVGRVTTEAGRAPLFKDFYAQAKTHRIDVTGEKKTVKCDIHKQVKHRYKSAFLHQSHYLGIPIFAPLQEGRSWFQRSATNHYRGPDIVTGNNLDLIIEMWGVQWRETADDRLLELSDRGASVGQVAATTLREELTAAAGNAADTTTLLLRSAQMELTDLFDVVLSAVEDAIVKDTAFDHIVSALHDFVVLHSYRDSAATAGQDRFLGTISTLFSKSCLLLPGIATAPQEEVAKILGHLQTLVRVALTFEDVLLDRQLLVERIQEMVARDGGTAAIRGAGFGILFSFGATREKVVAGELRSYLMGSAEQVVSAGAFLEGLFMTSKSIFMGSPRLIRAINEVLGQLEWDTFKLLLPDLRRAFTQFIPTEIDSISVRVSEEIGIDEAPPPDEPVPASVARVGATADRRVCAALEGWL
jgi:hypothetical protein